MGASKLLAPLEQTITDDALKKGSLKLISYSKDEMIHIDGEHCLYMELILEGEVKIERIGEDGGLLSIANLLQDDLIGGNLIFSKSPYYPMTVTAKTETLILRFSQDALFNFCSFSPDFLRLFLQRISDNATVLGDKLKHYVRRSLRESLTAFLLHEYMLQKNTSLRLKFTKKELADRMGVQRTSLSRELQKMRLEGLIDYDMHHIHIIDLDYFT